MTVAAQRRRLDPIQGPGDRAARRRGSRRVGQVEGKVAFVTGFLRLSHANSGENVREAVRVIAEHAGADAG